MNSSRVKICFIYFIYLHYHVLTEYLVKLMELYH